MSSPASQNVTNLVNLADIPLLNIFARLPLEQVLTLHRVSPRWRFLQAITLGRVQSLTVLSGTGAMYRVGRCAFKLDYTDYVLLPEMSDRERDLLLGLRRVNLDRSLKLDALSRDKVDLLINSFTSLVDVQLVLMDLKVTAECFEQLVTLLTGCRHRLQSLTLLVHFEQVPDLSQIPNVAISRLFESINALPHLKHLSIEAPFLGASILELSILGRLERFLFYSYDDPKLVLEALRRHAQTNERMSQVALCTLHTDFPVAINLEAQLSSRVTVMMLQQNPMDFDERRDEERRLLPKLRRMCHQFSALTYLEVDMVDYTTLELTTALKSLKQLFYLKLNLLDFRLGIEQYADHSLDHSADARQGPRLTSIQVLVLRPYQTSFSHQDLANLFEYEWTFPAVRLVHVDEYDAFVDCGPCRQSGHHSGTVDRRIRPAHCIRQCMHAFKRCPGLVKAVYSRYYHYFTEFSLSDLNMSD